MDDLIERGVREQLTEGSGVWRTCTGCYNSEDGHPIGEYPHSEVFGCTLGAGCSECGGIGATWDTTDYGQMAYELHADMQEEDKLRAKIASDAATIARLTELAYAPDGKEHRSLYFESAATIARLTGEVEELKVSVDNQYRQFVNAHLRAEALESRLLTIKKDTVEECARVLCQHIALNEDGDSPTICGYSIRAELQKALARVRSLATPSAPGTPVAK